MMMKIQENNSLLTASVQQIILTIEQNSVEASRTTALTLGNKVSHEISVLTAAA